MAENDVDRWLFVILGEYRTDSLEFFKLGTKGVCENEIPRFSGLFFSVVD